MILNLRTRDNLLHLLLNRQSGHWVISRTNVHLITEVRIFNWDLSQVLKATYDSNRSIWDPQGHLIVGLRNCRIENFHINPRANLSTVWPFGQSSVVYSEGISVQISSKERVGIVHDPFNGQLTQNQIKDFFERIKKEIQLRGLDRVVFKKGNIPIPDWFRNWCNKCNVKIDVLSEVDIDLLYPVSRNLVWEDDILNNNRLDKSLD